MGKKETFVKQNKVHFFKCILYENPVLKGGLVLIWELDMNLVPTLIHI